MIGFYWRHLRVGGRFWVSSWLLLVGRGFGLWIDVCGSNSSDYKKLLYKTDVVFKIYFHTSQKRMYGLNMLKIRYCPCRESYKTKRLWQLVLISFDFSLTGGTTFVLVRTRHLQGWQEGPSSVTRESPTRKTSRTSVTRTGPENDRRNHRLRRGFYSHLLCCTILSTRLRKSWFVLISFYSLTRSILLTYVTRSGNLYVTM